MGSESGDAHPPRTLLPRLALLLALLAPWARVVSAAAEPSGALRWAMEHASAAHDDLLALAAFPSISALPQHALDVRAAAGWLAARLARMGLADAQVLETQSPDHPVVFAQHSGAGRARPTVLIYGHYDVQPVDPLELWQAPPFEPAIRQVGGTAYFYGRGVDDDKGGLLQPLHALEALLQATGSLPVNVKLLLEGQEEIGSPHLQAFLEQHRGGLLAGIDLAVSADGGQIAAEQPGICTGLRGAVALEVQLTTAAADMHSGVWGGQLLNANHALARLLAGLHDERGRVTVPGFYDGVMPASEEDAADIAAFPWDEAAQLAALGARGFHGGEAGRHPLERRWLRPTLEVVGMWGGFTGAGMKTVLPYTAAARISCRLVPGQRPEDVTARVQAHLEAAAPAGANVTVQVLGFKASPWTSPKDTPGNRLAAQVLEQVMGKAPAYYKDGGTIPALAYFQSVLGVPSTIFAFGLGDGIHAPNERLRVVRAEAQSRKPLPALLPVPAWRQGVDLFDKGREAWVRYLALLGDALPRRAGSGAAAAASRDEL